MPGVSEDAIRAAIEAGVRAALAQLAEPEVVEDDDWPEWDELGGLVVETVEDEPPPGHTALRARSRGLAAVPEIVDEPDEITPASGGKGHVVDMGTGDPSVRGFGFNPIDNAPEWWARQYQKDVALQKRKVAYEDEVKQVR